MFRVVLVTDFVFVLAVLVELWTNFVSGQASQDVHLELRKRTRRGPGGVEMESILNHDWLDIATIGERANFDDTFLVCLSSMQNETTKWYFPNGTVVSSDHSSKGPDIYASKNGADTLVRLNRRRNATTPTGIYRCKAFERSGIMRSLYVGIYSSAGGVIDGISLTYNSSTSTLSCTSTGGPVTNITWRKDDKLLFIDGTTYQAKLTVIDTEEAFYENTLSITLQSEMDLNGTYSCEVSNSRSSQAKSIVIGTDFSTTSLSQTSSTGTTTKSSHMLFVATKSSQMLFVSPVTSLVSESSLVIFPSSTLVVASIMTASESVGVSVRSSTAIILSPSMAASSEASSVMIRSLEAPSIPTTSQEATNLIVGSSSNVGAIAAGGIIGGSLVAVFVFVGVFIILRTVLRFRQQETCKLQLGTNDERRLNFTDTTTFSAFETVAFHNYLDNNPSIDAYNMDIVQTAEHPVGGEASPSNSEEGPTFEDPILKPQFSKHVRTMHQNRDKFFEVEYNSLDNTSLMVQAVANHPCNKTKNRFANNHPYDFSRVVLKEIDGNEGSDYINASFVDGHNKPKAYIAAQGPMPNTVNDFWRMIWEYKINTIVMLTRCIELSKRKCEQYWPDSLNESVDICQGLCVSLTSFVQLTEYTIRKMSVSCPGDVCPLELTQFHYTSWPDHGVPADCIAMTKFIKHVRKLQPYSDPCPLLIHCSAGVGRTGTFIVLDSMLERMKTEDTLNIYAFVKQLRNQRVLMVQTLKQYMFIHDVIAELITCGDTEISATNLRLTINRLSKVNENATTGFSIQFKTLEEVSSSVSSFDIPSDAEANVSNNYEATHVQLKSRAKEKKETNCIDGYKRSQVYITTLAPLDTTIADFWNMIWEKKSRCIVQLSPYNQKSCNQYWPTERGHPETYGKLNVSLASEKTDRGYTTRTLELTEIPLIHTRIQTEKSKVAQFHVQGWPPMTSSVVILDLIEKVNKIQMGQGRVPIIVVCDGGDDHSGAFICIHAQLERLKSEGVVDIFQFVKGTRIKRPGFVSDLADYILCHAVAADFLDGFEDYANFKELK